MKKWIMFLLSVASVSAQAQEAVECNFTVIYSKGKTRTKEIIQKVFNFDELHPDHPKSGSIFKDKQGKFGITVLRGGGDGIPGVNDTNRYDYLTILLHDETTGAEVFVEGHKDTGVRYIYQEGRYKNTKTPYYGVGYCYLKVQ